MVPAGRPVSTTLRAALDDVERHCDHPARFPGERRSTTGRFTGDGGRLVHAAPDDSLRDFGYPLSKCAGIDRSRFGLRRGDEVVRFDDLRACEQSYVGSTTVRTVLDEADGPATVEQHDRTLGDGHCTHVAVRGAPDAELVAAVAFAPENQESRVGRPHHGDAVEAFHDREHDYLASATGIAETVGRRPSTFETRLAGEPEPLTATGRPPRGHRPRRGRGGRRPPARRRGDPPPDDRRDAAD